MEPSVPANCTCFNLRKAARAVTQVYDEALRPTGLRATQLALLNVVAEAGPADMKVLAKTLVMDRTTLTRNLGPLMQQGFVEVADTEDRRHRPIALTAKGRGKLSEALPLWLAVQTRMAKGLGADRWAGLLRDLDEAVHLAEGA